MQPLQGGGQMFQNLPGVHLDTTRHDSPKGTCTDRTVNAFDFRGSDAVGTVHECNFGHFSIRHSMRKTRAPTTARTFPIRGAVRPLYSGELSGPAASEAVRR